jgi:hypothetical protein
MRHRASHRVLDENQVDGHLVAMRLHMVLNDDQATTALNPAGERCVQLLSYAG